MYLNFIINALGYNILTVNDSNKTMSFVLITKREHIDEQQYIQVYRISNTVYLEVDRSAL